MGSSAAAGFVALVILAGGATVRQTYGPDGGRAYTLNCSGMARGWDKCLSSAGERCGAAGYTVIERSDEPAAFSGASVNGNQGSGFAGLTNERSMLVACRK